MDPPGGRNGRNGRRNGRGLSASQSDRPKVDGTKKGFLFIKQGASFSFPAGLSARFCFHWCIMGKACTKPFGACDFRHGFFDRMSDADKKLIIAAVESNDDVWFNAAECRRMPADKKWMCGDHTGPSGNRPTNASG